MIEFLKQLAESNTINFIIMLVILAVIVVKLNLKTSLNSSVEHVETTIKNSDTAKQDSELTLSKSKTAIEKLPQDIKNLEKEAELKADVFKAQIEETAQKEILGFQKSIDRALSIEEKKISNLLQGKTIISSIETAKNNICTALSQNPQLHEKFIEESLDELEKVKL